MELSARVRAGLACAILILTASSAFPAVPPEVPQRRTYSIFSPFDFVAPSGDFYGANIIASGGPACLAYESEFDLRQTAPATTSKSSTTNVTKYRSVLQTQAGIYYAVSHGGEADGSFVVEPYAATPDGLKAATTAVAGYWASDVGKPWEIKAKVTSDGYYGVGVTSLWIQRILNQAHNNGLTPRHDIVSQQGCFGQNQSLAFVNRVGLTRNYVAQDSSVPLVSEGSPINPSYYHQVSSAIFNNMSGIRVDAVDAYYNVPIGYTMSRANAVYPLLPALLNFRTYLSPDQASPDALNMRLYNAPRIVLSDVDQDSDFNGSYDRELYRYNPYPTYPYGSGTKSYPGPVAVSGQISNSSGPLRINLVFSEPMDVSSFTARLRYADGSTQAVSGSWGSYELTNDSWTATTSITSGVIRLEVFGRKVVCGSGQDTTVMYLDLDGDGTGVPGTYDTSGEFTVDTVPPPAPTIRSDSGMGLGGVVSSTASPNAVAVDTGSGV